MTLTEYIAGRADIRWINEGRAVAGNWCKDARRYKSRATALAAQPRYAKLYPSDWRVRPIIVYRNT